MKTIVLSLVLFLSACSLLKARPAEHAGFLPKPELVVEMRERAPFNFYWVFDAKQYAELRKDYGQVYIAPIDTSVVKEIYLASSGSDKTKQARIQEAEELASYFRAKLKLSLKAILTKTETQIPVRIVDKPGPKTLSLKLALVQVVPTNPGVNLVGTAAGFFVPGGGLVKLAGEGSVAMEGFTAENEEQKDVLEQFKDRESHKASAFTVKDYQRYAHIRVAIDDWADQLATLLTTPSEVQVEDSLPLSLNPL